MPYSVFSLAGSSSRPVRADLYLASSARFLEEHGQLLRMAQELEHPWTAEDYERANRVVYTAVMAFACCYDLWQRSSRKTPGTFFEVFMAGLLQNIFPEALFSKHIPLTEVINDEGVDAREVNRNVPDVNPQENGEHISVSTDIVIGAQNRSGGVVIPLKITTRERIVQPFAQQRILDAAFGAGHFKSFIVCISETQLDEIKTAVNQICVPGTIKLFQRFLAPVAGLYYCDLPQRYAAPDVARIICVKSVGHLFADIRTALAALT